MRLPKLFSQNHVCDMCGTLNPPRIHKQSGNGRLTSCCATYDREGGKWCYSGYDKDGKKIYTAGKATRVWLRWPFKFVGFWSFKNPSK